jgi:hypothetical protein
LGAPDSTGFGHGSHEGRDQAWGPFVGFGFKGAIGERFDLIGRFTYSFTHYRGTAFSDNGDREEKRDVGGAGIDLGLRYNF